MARERRDLQSLADHELGKKGPIGSLTAQSARFWKFDPGTSKQSNQSGCDSFPELQLIMRQSYHNEVEKHIRKITPHQTQPFRRAFSLVPGFQEPEIIGCMPGNPETLCKFSFQFKEMSEDEPRYDQSVFMEWTKTERCFTESVLEICSWQRQAVVRTAGTLNLLKHDAEQNWSITTALQIKNLTRLVPPHDGRPEALGLLGAGDVRVRVLDLNRSAVVQELGVEKAQCGAWLTPPVLLLGCENTIKLADFRSRSSQPMWEAEGSRMFSPVLRVTDMTLFPALGTSVTDSQIAVTTGGEGSHDAILFFDVRRMQTPIESASLPEMRRAFHRPSRRREYSIQMAVSNESLWTSATCIGGQDLVAMKWRKDQDGRTREASMHRLLKTNNGIIGNVIIELEDKTRQGLAMVQMVENTGAVGFWLEPPQQESTCLGVREEGADLDPAVKDHCLAESATNNDKASEADAESNSPILDPENDHQWLSAVLWLELNPDAVAAVLKELTLVRGEFWGEDIVLPRVRPFEDPSGSGQTKDMPENPQEREDKPCLEEEDLDDEQELLLRRKLAFNNALDGYDSYDFDPASSSNEDQALEPLVSLHQRKGKLSDSDMEAAWLALEHGEPLTVGSLSITKKLRALMGHLHLPDLPRGFTICETIDPGQAETPTQDETTLTKLVWVAQALANRSWELPNDFTFLGVRLLMRALVRMGLVVCRNEIPGNSHPGFETYLPNRGLNDSGKALPWKMDFLDECDNGDHSVGALHEEQLRDMRRRALNAKVIDPSAPHTTPWAAVQAMGLKFADFHCRSPSLSWHASLASQKPLAEDAQVTQGASSASSITLLEKFRRLVEALTHEELEDINHLMEEDPQNLPFLLTGSSVITQHQGDPMTASLILQAMHMAIMRSRSISQLPLPLLRFRGQLDADTEDTNSMLHKAMNIFYDGFDSSHAYGQHGHRLAAWNASRKFCDLPKREGSEERRREEARGDGSELQEDEDAGMSSDSSDILQEESRCHDEQFYDGTRSLLVPKSMLVRRSGKKCTAYWPQLRFVESFESFR